MQKVEIEYANTERGEKHTQRDWNSYNAAQTSEKLLAMRLLNDAVAFLQIPYEYSGNGRPPLGLEDMIKTCVIKVYNNFSSRRVMSDLRLAWDMQCLGSVPHFNILNKYLRSAEITPYLHLLYKTLATPLINVESTFAVDATGFSISKKHWIDYKLIPKEVRGFKKLHIITGVRTNVITDVQVSDGLKHDSPYFKGLVGNTAKMFRMREVCADAGYLSRDNCTLVRQFNAFPFIMPRKGTSARAKGSWAWAEMMELWKENKEVFRQHYHQRSNVESTFSMMKRKFLPYLRSKSEQGQVNELLCKVCCHNLSVLVKTIFELDIDPKFKKITP